MCFREDFLSEPAPRLPDAFCVAAHNRGDFPPKRIEDEGFTIRAVAG